MTYLDNDEGLHHSRQGEPIALWTIPVQIIKIRPSLFHDGISGMTTLPL
jgi:hypothetical protein